MDDQPQDSDFRCQEFLRVKIGESTRSPPSPGACFSNGHNTEGHKKHSH